ncbi:MAG: hypothetical protein ACRDOK_12005 [Streptosporangiaceae bacterium]
MPSLRSLLERPAAPLAVEQRSVERVRAALSTRRAVRAGGRRHRRLRAGADACRRYRPGADDRDTRGRARRGRHRGAFSDLDQTYSALGTYVAEREIGVEGPIRELYLVSPFDTGDESRHVTEVCWPVFRTAPAT